MSVRLPTAPQRYDMREQAELRRILEAALARLESQVQNLERMLRELAASESGGE